MLFSISFWIQSPSFLRRCLITISDPQRLLEGPLLLTYRMRDLLVLTHTPEVSASSLQLPHGMFLFIYLIYFQLPNGILQRISKPKLWPFPNISISLNGIVNPRSIEFKISGLYLTLLSPRPVMFVTMR